MSDAPMKPKSAAEKAVVRTVMRVFRENCKWYGMEGYLEMVRVSNYSTKAQKAMVRACARLSQSTKRRKG